MCSFIILLLLLGRNGGCANRCNSSCNNSYRNYGKEEQNGCDCEDDHEEWNPGDYARSKEYQPKKENCGCGCSACEVPKCTDESPVVEREDIWTAYKRPSSGNVC